MKFLLGLVVLIVVGIGVVWFVGGFHSASPKELADQIRNGVKPGMTWQQVVAVRAPRKIQPYSENGQTPKLPYDQTALDNMVKKGELPYGFAFEFNFSEGEAVQVTFDDKGVVEGVSDMVTMQDLVTGSNWQH